MNDTPLITLEDLRTHGLLPDTYKAVYLSGSRVRGWGNAASNLNIYVITGDEQWQRPTTNPHPIALRPDTLSVEILTVDGCRWDVEYWMDAQVDQVLSKVTWDEYETGQIAGGRLTSYEIDFLERLTYARAITGEEWLTGRVADLRTSAYRASLVARGLNFADVAVEDAVGQMESGDIESAVLSARIAFGFSVDALLASHDEFGGSPKWRARRYRIAAPPEVSFDEYWALESMQSLDPAAPGKWVEEVVMFCRKVASEVEIEERP
ncbi:hypothetical protein [Streptomyces sp. MUM 178J]|uniref:hypothetical protein n=1 Tax=Streptomyces sp. MUM 178J TaxID=2791991 RepID=UPI001F042625|nr:hypothetical protein [Streptomyces sp. MUM 178J]WRQ80754.1 hypothetical protein I3F59_016080 [Streptomyces sp. MUM 178J]